MSVYENYSRLGDILNRVKNLNGSTETEIVQIPTLFNPATSDEIIVGKQVINHSNGEVITGTMETQAGGKYDAPLDAALTVCPAGKVLSSDITLRPLKTETWTMKTSSTEASESTVYTYIPFELMETIIADYGINAALYITFENGMTWSEWIESEYNTVGIMCSASIVMTSSSYLITYMDDANTPVKPTDKLTTEPYIAKECLIEE